MKLGAIATDAYVTSGHRAGSIAFPTVIALMVVVVETAIGPAYDLCSPTRTVVPGILQGDTRHGPCGAMGIDTVTSVTRRVRWRDVHQRQRIVQFLAALEADLICPVFDCEDTAKFAVMALKQVMKDHLQNIR